MLHFRLSLMGVFLSNGPLTLATHAHTRAQYGARPLKRTIQREVETPIAKGILSGSYPPGSTVMLDARPGDDRLTITAVFDTDPFATTPSTNAKATKVKTLTII